MGKVPIYLDMGERFNITNNQRNANQKTSKIKMINQTSL